jgi:hypothetical protein
LKRLRNRQRFSAEESNPERFQRGASLCGRVFSDFS